MPSFSHAVTVSEPPAAVFPWLLEPDRVPRWTSRVERYEQLDPGPLRAGSRLRQTLEVGGSPVSFDMEVVRYAPPEAAEVRFSTNGVELANTYRLEGVAGGTRITQELDAKAGSFAARMIIPVVQGRLERKLVEDLERLRALLDART